MAQALTRYRVMAYIVGVLLIVLFAAWGLELFLPEGSTSATSSRPTSVSHTAGSTWCSW